MITWKVSDVIKLVDLKVITSVSVCITKFANKQVLIQISENGNVSQTGTVSQDYIFALLEST